MYSNLSCIELPRDTIQKVHKLNKAPICRFLPLFSKFLSTDSNGKCNNMHLHVDDMVIQYFAILWEMTENK